MSISNHYKNLIIALILSISPLQRCGHVALQPRSHLQQQAPSKERTLPGHGREVLLGICFNKQNGH